MTCPQINPIRMVPMLPTSQPAFLKARGIASTPEPREAFRRWASAPKLLKIDKTWNGADV